MRTLFKLILLAALVYGGWYLWKNYDVLSWYNQCKAQISQTKGRACLKFPVKKGSQIQNEPTFYIKDCQFSPKEMVVLKDSKVLWHNQDSVEREVVGDNFDSSLIPSGKAYSKVFNQAGIFNFICADQSNNKGRLIVQ